ncbi:MAG: hypothetical protein JWP88_1185 [Flaviaesturariibacter sp.]|nr:hypothetical protein [Flaviaesturariibacter sp.]
MNGEGDAIMLMKDPIPGKPTAAELERLLGAIIDVICSIDAQGYFRYVSPASSRLWGYSPEEMTDQSFVNFILPDDIEKTVAIFRDRTPDCCTSNFENRYTCKDGTIVPVTWSGRWDEEAGLMYCVARNGAEKAEVEQRLQKAQQMARIGTIEFDMVNKQDIFVSPSCYELFGLDPARPIIFSKEAFWDLVHPDDRERLLAEFRNKNTNREVCHEYRIIRPDGKLIYINHLRELVRDSQGEYIKSISTIQDITDRKITELSVKQSEQRFRSLVQNSTDLIGIIDAAGVYLYVTDSVLPLLGYAPEAITGRNAFEFIHPEDQPMALQQLASVTTKDPVKAAPFRFLDAAGTWRWIESTVANFCPDPAIGGYVVNSRDITEMKASDDKLRLLSLVTQNSNNGVIIMDLDDKAIWVNSAFTRIAEHSEEEIIGRDSGWLLSGTDGTILQDLKESVLAGKYVQKEITSLSKSGNEHWLEIQAQPIYNAAHELIQVLGIVRDITARKKAEAKLAASEHRFKSLVENGSDLITILDSEGTFTYVSDNAAHIVKYLPELLKGKNAFDLIHQEDVEAVINQFKNVMINQSALAVSYRFKKGDGAWIWLESKGTNHLDNPAIQGFLINTRDINERVELQKKLDAELLNKQKEITAAAIKAQEMERSQLGLELHDNVNQVLTTVKLYNEMFLTGYVQDPELLRKSTGYVQDCINEIRSISKRLSAPTLGNISMRDSISELVESINLTNRLEIEYQTTALEGCVVSQDLHLAIYRIIQEGLNNILKYAEAKTAVIGICYRDGKICVHITDDGKGFDLKAKRTGIGITNMKTRAENLNGSFSIKSAVGKGCQIDICIPA